MNCSLWLGKFPSHWVLYIEKVVAMELIVLVHLPETYDCILVVLLAGPVFRWFRLNFRNFGVLVCFLELELWSIIQLLDFTLFHLFKFKSSLFFLFLFQIPALNLLLFRALFFQFHANLFPKYIEKFLLFFTCELILANLLFWPQPFHFHLIDWFLRVNIIKGPHRKHLHSYQFSMLIWMGVRDALMVLTTLKGFLDLKIFDVIIDNFAYNLSSRRRFCIIFIAFLRIWIWKLTFIH